MAVIAWVGAAAGAVLLAGTAASVAKTLLIPRSTRSAITSFVVRGVRGTFVSVTSRVADLRRREQILAVGPAVWLVALLACWLAALVLGFGLVLWPLTAGGFPAALTAAGSSLFTLGFIRPTGPATTAIAFVAGASGLGVVALLIAYLPVLYAAFNRRETVVTMLEALAGAPPWGPELLARQALIGDIAYLRQVYERWTEWAADISESHTNYRTLVYFRSPDPTTSWALGLLAVLDAAALHMALCPVSAPPEARPVLRVGYLTMRRLAADAGLTVPEDPLPGDPVELSRGEYDEAVARLVAAGWTFERTPDEAWAHFRGWRVNYERAAYELAYFLDLPPSLWSGERPGRRAAPQFPVRPPHREPGKPDANGPGHRNGRRADRRH